jgi:hypothetical protein
MVKKRIAGWLAAAALTFGSSDGAKAQQTGEVTSKTNTEAVDVLTQQSLCGTPYEKLSYSQQMLFNDLSPNQRKALSEVMTIDNDAWKVIFPTIGLELSTNDLWPKWNKIHTRWNRLLIEEVDTIIPEWRRLLNEDDIKKITWLITWLLPKIMLPNNFRKIDGTRYEDLELSPASILSLLATFSQDQDYWLVDKNWSTNTRIFRSWPHSPYLAGGAFVGKLGKKNQPDDACVRIVRDIDPGM